MGKEIVLNDGEVFSFSEMSRGDLNSPINLRVQSFLLLSANLFKYTPKKSKEEVTALSLILLDASGVDENTGQPLFESKKPVITAFIQNPSFELANLVNLGVFSRVVLKISGNEGYIRIHDVLSESEVKIYNEIIGK